MIETIMSIDFEELKTVIAALIAAVAAVYGFVQRTFRKKSEKAFSAQNDLMNPYKPQTKEQTEVMKLVDPETYTMTDDNIYKMWKELVASRANLSLNALTSTVRKMEESNVEYIIVTFDHDGKGETLPDYAFVSYGTYTIVSPDEIESLSVEHGGLKKCYVAG